MKELLKFISMQITNGVEPEVVQTQEEGGTAYVLKVPQEFVGLLIGKEGKTIRAMRTLAKTKNMLERVKSGEEYLEKIFVRIEEI